MSAFSTDGKQACHLARNFNGRPHPGLDVNFLPYANGHITAQMIGQSRSFSAHCWYSIHAQSLEAKPTVARITSHNSPISD